MNRLFGLLYTHVRSIQVLHYKDKVIYEIPLLYGETINNIKPTINATERTIIISYPKDNHLFSTENRWTKSQPSQSASTSVTSSKVTTMLT